MSMVLSMASFACQNRALPDNSVYMGGQTRASWLLESRNINVRNFMWTSSLSKEHIRLMIRSGLLALQRHMPAIILMVLPRSIVLRASRVLSTPGIFGEVGSHRSRKWKLRTDN